MTMVIRFTSFKFIYFLIITCFTSHLYGQKIQTPRWSDEGFFGYLEYLPDDYKDTGNKKYPLLIFLHGLGEIGNGKSDIWKVAKNGPPKHIENGDKMTFTVNGETYKYIVISPQLGGGHWSATYVDKVIEYAKKAYRVDENKVYLTGLSLGGSGVWNYIVDHPEKLAAAAPICGNQNVVGKACKIANANLPVWVFHGDADRTINISYSIHMTNSINACNPSVPPRLTKYKGVGHSGAWQRGYTLDNKYHTPNLYEWFLSKSRLRLIVDAGSDKTVAWPKNSTTIKGEISYPSDSIKSIKWTKEKGGIATLIKSNTLELGVSNMAQGEYIFRMTVEAKNGAIAFDDVKVKVVRVNQPPIADAGVDQVITQPQDTLTLDGLGSNDVDGEIISYLWRQLDGPGGGATKKVFINLTQNSKATGNWNDFSSRPVAGLGYKNLKDINGNSSGIDITFETNWGGSNELGATSPDNSGVYPNSVMRGSYWFSVGAHMVRVSGLDTESTYNLVFFGSRAGGGDRTTVYKVGNRKVFLNASDNIAKTVSINYIVPNEKGEIVFKVEKTPEALYGYLNALVIEANPNNMLTPTEPKLSLAGLAEGEYLYELEVKDNEGGIGKDEVKVTVKKGSGQTNHPPVANAGEDKVIVLPNNSISIDGSSSSDQDGDSLSYAWEKISGSDDVGISGANEKVLLLENLKEGEYEFRLIVKDSHQASDYDVVKVFVKNDDECGCDFTITPENNKYKIDGNELGVKPGDMVCIEKGEYPFLRFYNFEGSETAPILFKNKGGLVKVIGKPDVHNGITMNYCQFFRFTGTGDSTLTYGIEVAKSFLGNGIAISTSSSNYEIDHLDIHDTNFAGVMAKADPHCDWPQFWRRNFTLKNISFHNLYIHNTGGEGMYIGYTAKSIDCNGETVYPHNIEGIKVFDNLIENSGWDGIQVSKATKDCEIYGNVVRGYAVANEVYQDMGILIGGGATGNVYNNIVDSGNGPGIVVFGSGNNKVYNNIIINAGNNDGISDGIFCDDRSTIPGRGFYFINNTIIKPSRNGIRIYSDESTGNLLYNNLTVAPGMPSFSIGNKVDYDSANNYFEDDIAKLYFVSPSKKDYRLTALSPVIDKGKDVNVYGIKYDFENNLRPEGNGYDIGAYEFIGAINKRPNANAGEDQSHVMPVSEVVLDGRASSDPDGVIVSYAWEYISGPDGYLIHGSDSALALLEVSDTGSYVIELTVTDDQGASSSDKVVVEVTAEVQNRPPTANAGEGQSHVMPVGEVVLDGSASSDPDGVIVEYNWIQVSGPAILNITNADSVKAGLSNFLPGVYVLELEVIDDDGSASKDKVSITITQPNVTVPVQVNASDGTYEDKIVVSWEGNNEYYKVFRSENTDTLAVSSVTDWIKQKTYIDQNIEVGKEYYYSIKSSVSVEGAYSSGFSTQDKGFAKKVRSRVLKFSEESIDFGDVLVDSTASQVINVSNLGDDLLLIDSVGYPEGFSGDWNGGKIFPGTSVEVRLNFTPREEKKYFRLLTVHSNATEGGGILDLLGVGSVPIVSGVEETTLSTVVYPNPFNANIKIQLSNSYTGPIKFYLLDISGRVVYNEEAIKASYETSHQLTLPSLKQGMYLVKIKVGKGWVFKKMLKEL